MTEVTEEIIEALKEQEGGAEADVYTGVRIRKDLVCTVTAVNPSAVFIILPMPETEIKEQVFEVTRALCLGPESYFFFEGKGRSLYYDPDTGSLVPVNDLYEAFFNLYFPVVSGNFSYNGIGQADLELLLNGESRSYEIKESRHFISGTRMEAIRTAIENLLLTEKTVGEKLSKYKVIDGVPYVRKMNLQGEYEYYPIADTNPDDYYKKVLFFGAFGIHKFTDRQLGKGILYFLTAGFFGVFWAVDILTILLGNYRFKDGSYLGKVTDMKKALLLLPAGIAVNVLLVFLYFTAGSGILTLFQGTAKKTLENQAVQERILEEIQKGRN